MKKTEIKQNDQATQLKSDSAMKTAVKPANFRTGVVAGPRGGWPQGISMGGGDK